MRRDLIWGIVDILLALCMVFCFIINCINANWPALSMSCFALGMNITCAVGHFSSYRAKKKWYKENINKHIISN